MVFWACLNLTWKNQQPPSGRTGDSTLKLFPLITLISTPPSGPSGKALGTLDKRSDTAAQLRRYS